MNNLAAWKYSGSRSDASSIVDGVQDGAFHLDTGATSAISETNFVEAGEKQASRSTPNSDRALRFEMAVEAVSRMADLPDFDDFHIDQQTSFHALNLLGLLQSTFELTAPRLFPQDGEAVVFTWDHGRIKRLLTVAGDEMDLLDLNVVNQVRCLHDLPEGNLSVSHIIPLLLETVQLKSASTDK